MSYFLRFSLQPDLDEFFLLENGSLIRLDTVELLSAGQFCIETVNVAEEPDNEWITTAMVCFSITEIQYGNTIFKIYSTGTYILLYLNLSKQ